VARFPTDDDIDDLPISIDQDRFAISLASPLPMRMSTFRALSLHLADVPHRKSTKLRHLWIKSKHLFTFQVDRAMKMKPGQMVIILAYRLQSTRR